ncbi:MAG TPA: CD3324 family protein [Bacillota bacterium]|nr:CD3324 family protein [Bacillota bacterium]
MNYRNGKDFLPSQLLSQLQEFVEGEIIYIPRKNKQRAGWGVVNGTRVKIAERNREIYQLFCNGISVRELSSRYHLSEDSIRKVLQKQVVQSLN